MKLNMEHNSEEMVASIIDINTMWWNVEKVKTLFNPSVNADIMKIVISPGEYKDRWLWKYEKRKHF